LTSDACIEPETSITRITVALSDGTSTVRCGRATARQSAASAASASSGARYRRKERAGVTDARTSRFVKVIACDRRRSSQR
jgi:hypothetical protein